MLLEHEIKKIARLDSFRRSPTGPISAITEWLYSTDQQHLELLKSSLQLINVMDTNGYFDHSFYTCGEHHDRQNPAWKPFRLLERHCLEEGYDFFEARDMIEERIARRLKCECDLLRS
jgi:hypothetical protein